MEFALKFGIGTYNFNDNTAALDWADLFGPGDVGGVWDIGNHWSYNLSFVTASENDQLAYIPNSLDNYYGNGLTAEGTPADTAAFWKTRQGVAMLEFDLVDDRYQWDYNGMTGTFWFVSQLGAQCYTLDAGATMPVCQFAVAGFINRIVTAPEKAAILAKLNTVFATYHDAEVRDNTFTLTCYGRYADYGGSMAGEYLDIGTTLHAEFGTSAPGPTVPPWQTYALYATVSGLAPIEWMDLIVVDESALETLGMGWYDEPTTQVEDLTTRFPALDSVVYFAAYEGSLPATIHMGMEVFRFSTEENTPFVLTGRLPAMGNCTTLRVLSIVGQAITGELPDVSAQTALHHIRCDGSKTKLSGWAGGTLPATLRDVFLAGNALPEATVDALLVALVTANNTTGVRSCHLDGGTNAPPSAVGLAAKATLEGIGWTVLTN